MSKYQNLSTNVLKSALFFFLLVLSAVPINNSVLAQDLVVLGNGSSSENNVNIESSQSNQVTQSNEVSVENKITLDLNTGNNQAKDNIGTTSISTGNIHTNTQIKNSVNNSSVELGCCESTPSSEATISANGSDSVNNTSSDTNVTNNIQINQNASISNNIKTNLNTGSNKALDNNGDIYINTGDINIKSSIKNTNINKSQVNVGVGEEGLNLKIVNNGSESENNIKVNIDQDNEINIKNLADVKNNLEFAGNTGNNLASDNSGKVVIITGDITIDALVDNGPINSSTVDINCCDEKETPPGGGVTNNPPQPSVPNNPQNNPTPSNGGGSITTPGPMVLGASLGVGGAVLPASGNNFVLLMTILSGLMFFLGLYLRHHPGRDPGFVTC